ncbi:phosphotransferase system enzyme I (PtsI) [Lipingzhangella halophila]|uniref:Phosphoenolpyruvate-protein phosphotransferase n=1 Tax=Lipingzhangella halophila TaxID=1783352 RepID=A0A7W7RL90_9ACTN|nr:phosphoenolpyruvate--protein phosphotransferase [Lipingzhangella halophila]MBB4933862.1 phosphotransferase system enzyme I (PtsI) [Lipingzhangella halophila]
MAETLTGVGVGSGVGHGPVLRLNRAVPEPPEGELHNGDAEAESQRALSALEETAHDLASRGERAGGHAQEVLNAQALMARDPTLAGDVRRRVAEGASAARAVSDAVAVYREMLAAAGEYMAARVADLDDVRDRAVAGLLGVPVPGIPASTTPFVLVANDLAPADTALLDPSMVRGIVTREGGPTSHTAILARALGLPAVVACPRAETIPDGAELLVDGVTGVVVRDPDPAVVAETGARAAARASASEATGPGRTSDGHAVPLLANIGGPNDLPVALRNGAEGIGLYRTEFLFLDRSDAPGHEEQVAAYRAVLDAFPGGKVTVRTLDAGADKPLGFLAPPGAESNPALGVRGLRMLRHSPETLAAQLTALAAAARGTDAELAVMAPMVTDAADAEWFASAAADAGIAHAGVMIEVPVAALRARHLAEAAEFFSIGTNDLTQYACAADREISALGTFQDPWQPGVLDLVAATARAAAAAGRPCGVCGEAASDPILSCVLVGLGATSLSMGATALPLVRAALARSTLAQCREAAAAALDARDGPGAKSAAREHLPGAASLGL